MRSLLPILVLALTVATGAEAQAYARGPLPPYGVREAAANAPPAHAEPTQKARKRPASMSLHYSAFADAQARTASCPCRR
jgi:hypothetical protein